MEPEAQAGANENVNTDTKERINHYAKTSRRNGILVGLVIFTLIAVSWIGNLVYYYVHQLEEPVFLNHYYEVSFHPAEMLEVYFITHHSSDKQLISARPVLLPDEEGRAVPFDKAMMEWRVVYSNSHGKYGPYQVHKASLQQPYDWQPEGHPYGAVEESDMVYHFREMEVWFQDGTTYQVAVGDIKLLPWYATDPPWSGVSSMGSSTGESSTTVKMDVGLEMTEVELTLADRIGDAVDYQLYERGAAYSVENSFEFAEEERAAWIPPHELEEGEHLTVASMFRFTEEDIRNNDVYYSELRMRFRDVNEGGTTYTMVKRLQHSPWLNTKNVKQIVSKHRKGE